MGPLTRCPHILLVSHTLHQDPARRVTGAAQRLDMLVEAVRGLGTLDVLFFVPNETDISPAALEGEERRLGDRWQTDLTLTLEHFSHAPWRQPALKLASVLARSLVAGAFSWEGQKLGVKTSFWPQVRALERCLDRQPDLVIAHKPTSMAPLLLTRRGLPPIVYDLDDVEYIKILQRLRRGPFVRQRVAQALSLPLLMWQNACALRRSTATLVCSDADRKRLQHWPGGKRVRVVPNAQTPRAGLPLPESPTLLFVGTFWYRPNCEAVDHFVRHIWPLIRAVRPDARLVVAGEEPQKIGVFAEHPEGVEFTGFVEDLEAPYARCRVVVVPLLEGSGTRIKIIEAALFQRPIVTTTIGIAGLDLAHGSAVIVEDDPDAFARACVMLLEDDARATDLAAAAQTAVLERYDRRRIVGDLRALAHATAAKPVPLPRPGHRVALVGGTTGGGGLHRHTVELAESLHLSVHDVSILAMHADNFSRYARGPLSVRRTNLEEHGNPLTQLWRWWRELAPLAGRTFIYCRGSGGSGSISMLAALWLRGANLFTIEHRVPDPPGAARHTRRRRLAAKFVHRSIAVSDAVRNAVIEHCDFPPERIVTAVNWVDHEHFRPDRSVGAGLRAERAIAPECLVLGYVGRLGPEKRVDLLLRGLARARPAITRPVTLLIVGSGWKEAELRALASGLGLDDIVDFLGRQEEPLAWYRASDLVVLASLLEGMPLVVLESMATGTPCLMHAIDVAGELIEDGHTGFIRHLDSAADMAAALCEIAALPPADLAAMGAAARAHVVEAHDPTMRIASLIEALGISDGKTLE